MTPQNLLIQKKILWAEIKAMEAEYKRLQNQIELIESDKKQIAITVKLKLDKVQEIGEILLDSEVEYLKKHDL